MIHSVKPSREVSDDLRDGRGPRIEERWGHSDTKTFEKLGWELEVGEGRS